MSFPWFRNSASWEKVSSGSMMKIGLVRMLLEPMCNTIELPPRGACGTIEHHDRWELPNNSMNERHKKP